MSTVQYEVGDELRAVRRIAFKSGKVVEIGDSAVVTKVPGTAAGSPAQVKSNGNVFSAAHGDFEVTQAKAAVIPTTTSQEEETSPETPPPPCRTVPVRLTHYIDYVGHWGDTLQKQRVERMQKQLESAAGRLSEEAAAKFEEVAWLQAELEKWHAEAALQGRRADDLQSLLDGKDAEVARLQKGIEERDADIAWLKAELQKKIGEANAALADVARLEGQLRATLEELKRLERVAQQRTSDEADRRRDLEKRYEEMRNAKKALEDKLYLKMEELARAEQAIKQLEQALRDGNLAFEKAKLDWEQQMDAQAKMIEQLRQQLAGLRTASNKGSRDAACQVASVAPLVRDSNNQTLDELKAILLAREAQLQQLESRLAESENYRSGLIDDLKAQLAQRDEHIRDLEAGTSNNWRRMKNEGDLMQRIQELEDELRKERMKSDDMQSRLDNQAASYERKLREMERRLRESDRRYTEVDHMKDLLNAKLANAAEIMAEQQREVDRLKEEVICLHDSLMAHKARLEHLDAVVIQLHDLLPKIHEASVVRLLSPLREALTLFPGRNPIKSPTRQRPPPPPPQRPGDPRSISPVRA